MATKPNLKRIFSIKFSITVFLLIFAIFADNSINQSIFIPQRKEFNDFPMQIGNWKGQEETINLGALKMLDPTDYLKRGYITPDGLYIDLFMTYHANQTEESRIHSPKSCLPGGGLQILNIVNHSLKINNNEDEMIISKAVVQKGMQKFMVLFWLQSRGRILTNEYIARFYLLLDSILKNRSDGSLIRIITPISEKEEEVEALIRLEKFIALTRPLLGGYIPD